MPRSLPCLLLLLASLLGCASDPPLVGRVPGAELPVTSSALVLAVPDAEGAGGEPVPATGDALQAIVRGDLTARGWDVLTADTASRVAGRARARDLGLAYVLEARFRDWHEAKVDYRADPDRVELELRLRRADDGALVAFAEGAREGGTLADVDGRATRLLPPLVQELMVAMLDGPVLPRLPRDE